MDRAACIVCADPAGDHAFMCKVCQKPVHGRCGSIKDEECLTCIKDRNRRLGLEIGRAAFFLVCLLVILRMVVIPLLAWYSVPPSTDDSVRFVYTERRVCEFFGNCDDADEIVLGSIWSEEAEEYTSMPTSPVNECFRFR